MRSRKLIILLLAVAMIPLLNSCESLQRILSRDLEEEDFIIGQLYADELVKETPVISKPQPATNKPNSTTGKNALGLTYSKTDNAKLYETINGWLGVPYRYGGNDRTGIDCSAFVGTIYKTVYSKTLKRTCNDMLNEVTLLNKTQIKEGDLLFFTNSKGKVAHVGIYLKEGLFAHASTSSGVCVSSIDDTYWSKHLYRGGRVK
ncbi:MAG: C40 family peptidase [Bacteroidales bacterium]|nr:C40 family peptidase [Bacteroidales bacterium]